VTVAPIGHHTGFPPARFLEDLTAQLTPVTALRNQSLDCVFPTVGVTVVGMALDPHHVVPAVSHNQIGEGRRAKGTVR